MVVGLFKGDATVKKTSRALRPASRRGRSPWRYVRLFPLAPTLLAALLLLLTLGNASSRIPIALAAATSASLDQCGNGTLASPNACTGSGWQNGNLNSNNAHYRETNFVPFRALVT